MLHLLAFFCAICGISLLFKLRFEQALPMAVLSGMLVLTGLAMLQRLHWVDGLAVLVIAASVALAAAALLLRRVTPGALWQRFARHMLTPGLLCFALLAAFFLYATQPMVVWWKDDISWWGLEVKSLWSFGGLVEGARHLNGFFATYTPGMQVLQWWMMHAFGQWQESTLYFVLFMTYAVFLLPLCSRLRWKQIWLVPLAALAMVVFPVWGNVVSYVFLGVDTSLALCFGYTLIQLWLARDGDPASLLAAGLGMCGMVLIKQIGALLAVMAMVMLLLLRRPGKKEWLCLLSPVLVWGGWMVFCQVMGLSGFHTSGIAERLGEMLGGTYVPPEGAEGVGEALWYSLTVPYTDSLIFDTSVLVHIPKLLWLALLAAAPLALAKLRRSKGLSKIALFFGVITSLFLALQFVSFFTVFYYETSVYVGPHKQNMVLLIERYLAPLLLGMGMFAAFLLVEAFPGNRAGLRKPLPWLAAAAAALVMAFTINWGVLYQGLLPDQYYQQDRSLGAEADTLMDHDWGEALEGYENAHVLVGLELNADYIKNFRYTFAPARFELPELSFLGDAGALRDYLLQNHITHLICFDDVSELYPVAAELMPGEELYPWTLYEVQADGDQVALVEYY